MPKKTKKIKVSKLNSYSKYLTGFIIPFLLLALILVGGSCGKSSDNNAQPGNGENQPQEIEFLTYSNNEWGFEIKYPDNWVKEIYEQGESGSTTAFNSPKRDSENRPEASLIVVAFPRPGSKDFNSEMLKSIAQLEGSDVLISQSLKTISGHNAYELVYFDSGGPENKILHYFVEDEDIWYQIVYVAKAEVYSEYLLTGQEMIDSFVITK